LFNLDDCIAFITCQSGKIFSDVLERKLAGYKATRSQWIAMHYIYNCRNLTQRELADKMSVSQPTVVRFLQSLEFKGYLKRISDDKDKRVKQLELTEEGIKVYLDILPVVEEFQANTLAGISQEDLNTVKNTLDTMIRNALVNV
jgi:MarR family transcriptional regulator for hemolysin